MFSSVSLSVINSKASSSKAVIARLVRDCAQGRAIQYAGIVVIEFQVRGVLDAPPARGMTREQEG
jgi:hypothetical protein